MLTQEKLIELGKGNDCMPPTKIEAFFAEISWLNKYVRCDVIRQIYVSRAESELLNYSCSHEDVGLALPEYVKECIYLLDEHGELITTKKVKSRKKYFFWGPMIPIEENIQGYSKISVKLAIDRIMERANEVKYILSTYCYTQAAIIYKFPQNVSLKQWLENETIAERKIIWQEIADIG